MITLKRKEKLRNHGAQSMFREAVSELELAAETARHIQYNIGPQESANWGHYYHCHDDGAKLVFDWNHSDFHLCSKCGKAWSGEPFDSARGFHVHKQLGIQARSLAALWLIKGEVADALEAKRILLGYAEHYKGFPVHGDIPYNGPGKLFAQTLDESHWVIDICIAYDFIEDQLDVSERKQIKEGLLHPCAAFLIAHKEKQIHNHSLWITSAIGCLGTVMQDEAVMKAGMEGNYGFLDQVERGTLEDGFWYEGSMHYHIYALHAVIQLGLFTEDSPWDIRKHPMVRRMFAFPHNFILQDGTFPIADDMHPNFGLEDAALIYETAWDWYGSAEFAQILQSPFIGEAAKQSFEALLFGNQAKAGKVRHTPVSVSSQPSGMAVLVNAKGLELVVKHGPFGGEHDHMDRLGLSLRKGDCPIFVDPGTTAYGVPIHYGWFKHTCSHNTISVEGKDQPPADGELMQFHQEPWGVWCEGRVKWEPDFDYKMKDCIVLPEHNVNWDYETYRNVEFRRFNLLQDDFLVDVVKVSGTAGKQVDLHYHVNGSLADAADWSASDEVLWEGSSAYVQDVTRHEGMNNEVLYWSIGKEDMRQWRWSSAKVSLYRALTPDNPPTSTRESLVERIQRNVSFSDNVYFINVFELSQSEKPGSVRSVEVSQLDENQLEIKIDQTVEVQRLVLSWHSADDKLQFVHTLWEGNNR